MPIYFCMLQMPIYFSLFGNKGCLGSSVNYWTVMIRIFLEMCKTKFTDNNFVFRRNIMVLLFSAMHNKPWFRDFFLFLRLNV